MVTFIALLAAIGVGTIISAIVGHWTAISGHRQAWINALRDDIAVFFVSLDRMNYAIADFLKDSERHEGARRDARIALLLVYERIRLRLNRTETLHMQLEAQLRMFLDIPIGEMVADRAKIDEAADLARQVLGHEWTVTKYPWKGYFKRGDALKSPN